MALKLLNPGINPLGQFDALDADIADVKGGEVLQFGTVDFNTVDSFVDSSAYDSNDGYVLDTTPQRPVLRLAYDGYSAPVMLADDGVAGYGTLFGTVVGGSVGQSTGAATPLGPHTATGSGKLTAWDKPGLYAVSTDACDLTVANAVTGNALRFYVSGPKRGQLTTAAHSTTVSEVVAGYFVSFESNGSLVNTPNKLVNALNYGLGGGSVNGSFAYAQFHFAGAAGA